MMDLLTDKELGDLNRGATTEKLGGKSGGFLDSVLFALTGTPDQLLTPEDMKDRSDKRKQASQMATNAANDPGEQFMGIPSAGGSGGTGIGDLIKLGMQMFAGS